MEISRQLGLEAETVALDRAMAEGRIGPPEYAAQVYDLWADLTEAHVSAAFEGAPWLARIREVWVEIRNAGEYCAVVSLSPSFFVERLLDWGAHAAHGSRFPAVPFTEPVDPSGALSAAAKVTIADRLCGEFGVARADCVAYGDSMSDKDLFAAVPVSVRSMRMPTWPDLRPIPTRDAICGTPMNWSPCPAHEGLPAVGSGERHPRSGACMARTPSMLPSR